MIATIRDVARKAGGSVATVSRVISENGYPVAVGTRTRVLGGAALRDRPRDRRAAGEHG